MQNRSRGDYEIAGHEVVAEGAPRVGAADRHREVPQRANRFAAGRQLEHARRVAAYVVRELDRAEIGPMQVVQHQEQRPPEPGQELGHRVVQPEPAACDVPASDLLVVQQRREIPPEGLVGDGA